MRKVFVVIRKVLFTTRKCRLDEKESAELVTRKSITFVKCD